MEIVDLGDVSDSITVALVKPESVKVSKYKNLNPKIVDLYFSQIGNESQSVDYLQRQLRFEQLEDRTGPRM